MNKHEQNKAKQKTHTHIHTHSYYDEPEFVSYVCNAIDFVSTHGWKFLPLYLFEPHTGEWKNRNLKKNIHRRWLGVFVFVCYVYVC